MNSESSQPENVDQQPTEAAIPTHSAPVSQPTASSSTDAGAGPLNLEKIRTMRQALQSATAQTNKPARPNKPKNKPATKQSDAESENTSDEDSTQRASDDTKSDPNRFVAPRISVPTSRTPLSSDQEDELEQALSGADFDALMIGGAELQVGRRLESGQRYQAKVIKIHNDNVFLSLGGPDEGILPLLQFLDMPQVGQVVDCVVRGFNNDEGLYDLALPGESVTVEDWSDLEAGAIVEAKIESSNTGGLECQVGGIRGFIPLSQVSEFRIENASDYVGKTLTCVVTEANPRRGNLVLSHRAILEREKEAKRAERLASLNIGDTAEGTVRKVTDFGAFVDIGGLDGLIHISQLSWERVKHPSEVVKEGDQVKVRIEKIDPETGKIGLSYRSLQDHPWNDIDARFPTGAVVKGAVSRIANFGVFVRLATGIEGLVHVSELAHRRVTSPGAVVEEGQEVEVKVLSVDREAQRISLSLKQAQAAPANDTTEAEVENADPTPRPLAVAKRQGPLRGGTGSGSGGEKFGLKW